MDHTLAGKVQEGFVKIGRRDDDVDRKIAIKKKKRRRKKEGEKGRERRARRYQLTSDTSGKSSILPGVVRSDY